MIANLVRLNLALLKILKTSQEDTRGGDANFLYTASDYSCAD